MDRERSTRTAVSLSLMAESIGTFPIAARTANSARMCWTQGAKAAQYVRLKIVTDLGLYGGLNALLQAKDLLYTVEDLGTEADRVEPLFYAFAESCFALNKEACDEVAHILSKSPAEDVSWLNDKMNKPTGMEHGQLDGKGALSEAQLRVLCDVQAFFMGYHYSVLLQLVDVSSLRLQIVDGWWGFRHVLLIGDVRALCIALRRDKIVTREQVLTICAQFFLGDKLAEMEPTANLESRCLGIIGSRTLLCNSLIKNCTTPDEIGGFTLIDADTSGIPRDYRGFIRPSFQGSGVRRTNSTGYTITANLLQSGPDADFTRHIEPDWNGNAETMLLVMRYEGRRVGSLNPAMADVMYCLNYVAPTSQLPRPSSSGLLHTDDYAHLQCDHTLPEAIACTLEHMLRGQILFGQVDRCPVLVQARGRPCMRYAAAAWLGRNTYAVTTDFVRTALQAITDRRMKVVIAGL